MADALKHSMVPNHELLSDKQALEELEPWGITSKTHFNRLPLIAIDDPALVSAALRPSFDSVQEGTDWPIGQVVRITRRSAYSGISLAYRLVVGTSAFGRPAAIGNVTFEESEEVVLVPVEDEEDMDMIGVISEEDERILTDEEIQQLNESALKATEEEEEDV